jgi:osmotically-inducible protein OsmY
MRKLNLLILFASLFFMLGSIAEGFVAPPVDQMRGGLNNSLFPNQQESDQYITKSIQDALAQDYYLAPYKNSIEIYTIAGVVTLAGRLDSDAIKLKIGQKVRNVEGVKRVYNNIEVVHIWYGQ